MTQAQVSYTDLVLRYPVTGSLESVRLSSDVRERLIVECFTNNGVAGMKFREDGEEGWTPVSIYIYIYIYIYRRRSRRRKMGPGRTSGDPVDPVTIPDGATASQNGCFRAPRQCDGEENNMLSLSPVN